MNTLVYALVFRAEVTISCSNTYSTCTVAAVVVVVVVVVEIKR